MSRNSLKCRFCPSILEDRQSMSAATRRAWHECLAHNAPSPESRHAGFEEIDPVDALDLLPPVPPRPDYVSPARRRRFRFWEVA